MSILEKFALTPGDVNLPAVSGEKVLQNGLLITYFVAGIVAVMVIIIAGILLATNGDNPANVTKAKTSILYAVFGLIIVLSAFAITQYLIGGFQ